MTLAELSDFLWVLASEHFGDCVLWAEQYTPPHTLPLTTLKLKDATVPRHSVDTVRDGRNVSYYECTKILEVNSYADSVAGSEEEIYSLENPAADELTGFLLFLQSDIGTERAYTKNVCIEAMGPVRDLSELDRTRYRYRAMQEYAVRFTLEYKQGEITVHNPHGEESWEPVKEPVGYFERVETEDLYE
ncbi:MAG: hypothetical protein K1W20_04855 [Lachnospiraceae bacterium]